MLKKHSFYFLLAVGCLTLFACRPSTQSDQNQDSADEETSATNEPKDDHGDHDDTPAETESGEAGSSDSTAETNGQDTDSPAAGAAKTNKVTLGDPSLTAGIPGEGPLTDEDVAAWLDDPSNHETLEISLPKGLAAGASLIKGIEETPMTRAKIELGRQLYFDGRLSADESISCATCHDPDEGFSRHTQFGVGIEAQEGNRNSPVSYNRILSSEQFWDGRAKSLEEQAVGPIANPIEMGNTHDACVECVAGISGYKLQFDHIFEDGVTIDNIGKAIATFERAIVTGPSPYDYWEPLRSFRETYRQDLEDLELLKEEDPDFYKRYQELVAASEAHPFSESAERGREIFFTKKGNCTACHAGANFTDEKYHNLGVGMDADDPDLGRYVVTNEEKDKGAFKTPTVRNVAQSAPYMHDGSQESLMEVVEWYAKGGHPNEWLSDNVKKLELTEQDKTDLVAFMEALTGDFPPIERQRLPE